MYIVKNAFQNLARNKGRNLMIAGIIFVIIVSSVTALMINNTASGVIDDYKTRFGSEVSISPNMSRLMASGSYSNPQIPANLYLAFADSEYLLNSVLTARGSGRSGDITAIDQERGGGSSGPSTTGGAVNLRENYFTLLSGQYADFENGYRGLTDGSRFPEKAGECLISEELLEKNGLSIGDTIKVESDIHDPGGLPGLETYIDLEFDLTIVGTYYDLNDEYATGVQQNALNNRRNDIYMDFGELAGQVQEGYYGIWVTGTFYLKNPDVLDAFAAECYTKGLSDVFDVTTDESGYNSIIGPVEGMKGICVAFVIIVLVFGAIIIALLSSIAIRERKYEIGVLRAMGMGKGKVAIGLWTETIAITLLCLIIGIGVGRMVAQPVTNVLLQQQIEAAEKAQNNNRPAGTTTNTNANFRGQSSIENIKSIDVAVGMDTILQIIAIALLLSSLAGVISTRKITKYEPIKILMERN